MSSKKSKVSVVKERILFPRSVEGQVKEVKFYLIGVMFLKREQSFFFIKREKGKFIYYFTERCDLIFA
jgi:hypothetical protein